MELGPAPPFFSRSTVEMLELVVFGWQFLEQDLFFLIWSCVNNSETRPKFPASSAFECDAASDRLVAERRRFLASHIRVQLLSVPTHRCSTHFHMHLVNKRVLLIIKCSWWNYHEKHNKNHNNIFVFCWSFSTILGVDQGDILHVEVRQCQRRTCGIMFTDLYSTLRNPTFWR
jgi:hypothetical protein